jgi:hypothetical protein
MTINLPQRIRAILLILVLNCFLCAIASAQATNFVQITDPHLFDKEQDGIENRAALAACIKKINERMDEKAEYQFVVMTGDIGIENLVSNLDEATGKRTLEPDQAKWKLRIAEGAAQMAAILSASKVRDWFFLPGNNDLFDETPDTTYYRLFIKKLKEKLPGLQVIDLCPEETGAQQLGMYRLGGYAFLGFNNASFKNNASDKNNDALTRIDSNKNEQLKYVQQVADRLKAADITCAYVFYHIPELDDPHIVLNEAVAVLDKRKAYADNPYPYSSWFVHKDVHKAWQTGVVVNPKVYGLFAGHYHDWRRNTYQSYHWMQTADFPSGSLSKLYICPPIAIKRQDNTPSQARGFQEVGIDGTGRVSVRILWYDSAKRTFDNETDKKEVEALKQLHLGEIYERSDQFKEAGDAYAKALDSGSPVTRQRASDAVQRVTQMQGSSWNSWLLTRIGWPLQPFLAKWLTVILAVLLIALVYWRVRSRRQNRLGVDPFVDSTQNKQGAVLEAIIKATLEGMVEQQGQGGKGLLSPLPLFTETKPPALIIVPKLWEGADFIELAAKSLPGKYGEVAAWFLKRVDKPEYLIQGTFQSDGTNIHVMIRLKRSGRLLRVWNPVLSPPSLVKQQEDLALRVLIFLREYIVNEHAN